MNKELLQKLKPHLIAIAIFVVLTFAYLMPVLQGKQIEQHDIAMWTGMSKEIVDWKEKTGEQALWTNSMFSGMPSYQISMVSPANLMKHVNNLLWLSLPFPANHVFMLFLGFYILLITLKVDYRLSIAGSIAFALCSYNFVILHAGHNSKVHAIALIPFVLAGILMTLRGEYLKGFALTAIALALEIYANHIQISYYFMLGIFCLMISEAIYAFKEKRVSQYVKASLLIAVAAMLAVLPNITTLWATYEYGHYSTRGPSELTEKKISTGLDKDYALDWSNGTDEPITLLIPNFKGGASQSQLSKQSALYKALESNGAGAQANSFIQNAPTYWGDQPMTAGPTYAGAIMVFLFVLGLLIVEGRAKWWILAATILSVTLSMGKNFPLLTDLFFDHVPMYNKFRAVAMMLTMACFTIPLLAMLAVKKIIEQKNPAVYQKQLLNAFYIVGGFCAVFVLLPGLLFSFQGKADENFKQYDWLLTALREDRASLLRMDALRSLFFIALTFGLLWFYMKNKIKLAALLTVLAVITVFDQWTISKRYLNDDDFVAKSKAEVPFEPSSADQQILSDKDLYYRVMNTSLSTFNDASTSYFHKSIGGYHGAKLKRYQELIEYQIAKGNMRVLDMLNMKYAIQTTKEGQLFAVPNPGALGNAWFVNNYKMVADADAEMKSLDSLNPKLEAVVDVRFENVMKGLVIQPDSLASIKLTTYAPDKLTYQSTCTTEQLAVFSDIYYPAGWNAYVDGKFTDHVRADYVLRAMRIPAGTHTIEFKFEPTVYNTGEKIALAGSSALLILGAAALFFSLRKKNG